VKTHHTTSNSNVNSPRGLETPRCDAPLSRSYRSFKFGQTRQMRSDYLQRPSRLGNQQVLPQTVGPRADNVSALRKVDSKLPNPLLWVGLNLKIGIIAALVETGAKLSCVRSEVIDYVYHRGERSKFFSFNLKCLLADGSKAQATDAVGLRVRLLLFLLDHNFRVMNETPFPAINAIDFLERNKMRVDLSSRGYNFVFAPNVKGWFSAAYLHEICEAYLQNLCGKAVDFTTLEQRHPCGLIRDILMRDFPSLFSSSLGIAKCCPYDIHLSGNTLFQTPPNRCAPLSCKNLSR